MIGEGPPPLAPGTEVAPGYRLIAHLSRGRVLDVHDAWSDARRTRCIVKLLRPDRATDAGARARLVREGRLLRRLAHPHIVRGYEAMTAPRPLVVMETLGGETLSHVIDTAPRRLSVVEVAHLGLHLGSAVAYLHDQGWLHLDLKPGNVVADAGRAKLIDLSIARRPGRSRGGSGTRCYMAPEQVVAGELGPEADVWGLGTVLYEALTGQPAFDSPGGGDTRSTTDTGDPEHHPQLAGPPAPIGRLRRGVPASLVELVDRCLAQDPSARPSVTELLAGLERAAGLPPAERRNGSGRWEPGLLAIHGGEG